MENLYTYNILLSSPSDLAHEQKLIRDCVEGLVNQIVGHWACMRLNLIGWETHSRSGASTSAQDVIDATIPPYDIYLGVLWRKVGTPTNGSDSGTIYEYERAMELKQQGKVQEVMFYLKEDEADTKEQSIEDLRELIKVKEFKERLKDENVAFRRFSSDLELTDLLTMDLVNLCSTLTGKLVISDLSEDERRKRLSELSAESRKALQAWVLTNGAYEELKEDLKDEFVTALTSQGAIQSDGAQALRRAVPEMLDAYKRHLINLITVGQNHSESLSRLARYFSEFIAIGRAKPTANTEGYLQQFLISLQPIKSHYADNAEEGNSDSAFALLSRIFGLLLLLADVPTTEIEAQLKDVKPIFDLAHQIFPINNRSDSNVLATLEALVRQTIEGIRTPKVLRLRPKLGSYGTAEVTE